MLRLSTKAASQLIARLQRADPEGQASFFLALSDPMRIKIVLLMCHQKDLCVTDIAELLAASLPLISHHLRILKEAGLVRPYRMGQMQCYSLANQKIKSLVFNHGNQRKGVMKNAMPSM